jgi:hypothetical protein
VSLRSIAEAAFVLRGLVDAIEAAGSKNVAAHRAALDVVDAHVRGETATPRSLDTIRASLTKACARYANANKLPPTSAALYALPIVNLLWMVESGEDVLESTFEAAARSVIAEDRDVRSVRIATLREEAASRVAALDDTPVAGRAPHVETASERSLLERSRAALAGNSLSAFDAIRPARDASKSGDRASLERRLSDASHPAHEAVFAFEEVFGGLLIPVTGDDDWRANRLYTQVGASGLLESGYRFRTSGDDDDPHAALVPVAYGLQDDVYLLDANGTPWYHDPTGDQFVVPFGADAAELVTRLVLAAFTYASQTPQGRALWPPVAMVAGAADALGLTRLFADEQSEWWYGERAVIVVFRGTVYALARDVDAEVALGGPARARQGVDAD